MDGPIAVANGVVEAALTTPAFDKSQGESFKMLLSFFDFPILPPWFQKVIYSSAYLCTYKQSRDFGIE